VNLEVVQIDSGNWDDPFILFLSMQARANSETSFILSGTRRGQNPGL